jgi:hypothetical protein
MITASMILPEAAASTSAVASATTAARGHQGIHGGRREAAGLSDGMAQNSGIGTLGLPMKSGGSPI